MFKDKAWHICLHQILKIEIWMMTRMILRVVIHPFQFVSFRLGKPDRGPGGQASVAQLDNSAVQYEVLLHEKLQRFGLTREQANIFVHGPSSTGGNDSRLTLPIFNGNQSFVIDMASSSSAAEAKLKTDGENT